MIDYGVPPTADQIEVTLFGPGYGEAIAVHLGDGAWLLVDSCIDPDTKTPASETYLKQLGVAAGQVRAIVASHWHDDHVSGFSQLSETYPDADLVISDIFNSEEAKAVMIAYNGLLSGGLGRGAEELYRAIRSRQTVTAVHHRSIVLEATLNGSSVMVTALSPTSTALIQSVAHMAQFLPKKDGPINKIPELRPNMEAVALHIDLGDDAILLGADLEEHPTCGWSAVAADRWSGHRRRSTVYKVAHHGSVTGDCPALWSTLLQADPVACLTPFTRGKVRLPTDPDRIRVRRKASRAYISSGASRRPAMDSRLLKRLGDVCKNVAQANAGFGVVRLRRKIGVPTWNVELFGAAAAL